MTLINGADSVRLGNQVVDAVYLGSEKVWPTRSLDIEVFSLGHGVIDGGITTNNVPVTLTDDVPRGADVVLFVGYYSASGPRTLTADGGVIWSVDVNAVNSVAGDKFAAFLRANFPDGLAAGTTLHVTLDVACYNFTVTACCVTNIDQDNPVVKITQALGSNTTTWVTPEVLLGGPKQLLLGGTWVDFRSTFSTPHAGVTELDDWYTAEPPAFSDTVVLAYRIEEVPAKYTIGGTWDTGGSNATTVAVAYQPVAPRVMSLFERVLRYRPIAYYRNANAPEGSMYDHSGNGMTLSTYTPGFGIPYVQNVDSLIATDASDPGMHFRDGANVWSSSGPMRDYFTITPSVSISCWINSDALPDGVTSTWHDIVMKGPHWGMQLLSTGQIKGFSTTGGGFGTNLYSDTVIAPGEVHHLALTYDGTTLKLYVDGKMEKSGLGAGPLDTGGYNFVIAAFAAPENGFDGVIDEVAPYNYALNASQVLAIYQSGNG